MYPGASEPWGAHVQAGGGGCDWAWGAGTLRAPCGGSGPDWDCCFPVVLVNFPQKILVGVK